MHKACLRTHAGSNLERPDTLKRLSLNVGLGRTHLVIAGQTVDAALHQNEAELGVLVLALALQVLAHGNGLLDQAVQVLRDLSSQAVSTQDTQDLGASDAGSGWDTLLIPEQDTNLGWAQTLLGHLANHVHKLQRKNKQYADCIALASLTPKRYTAPGQFALRRLPFPQTSKTKCRVEAVVQARTA